MASEAEIRRAIEAALGIVPAHQQQLAESGFLTRRTGQFRAFSDLLTPVVHVRADGTLLFADSNGRVPTHETPLSEGFILGTDADIAGNVLTVNAIAAAGQYILEACYIVYDCDATVATRTVGFTLQWPYDEAGAGTSLNWYASPTVSLTANENGAVYVGRDAIEIANDNGTIARTTAGPPLPMRTAGALTQTAVATGGVAGDAYRMLGVGRRVA